MHTPAVSFKVACPVPFLAIFFVCFIYLSCCSLLMDYDTNRLMQPWLRLHG